MTFEQLRKPIVGATLVTTAIFGAGCGSNNNAQESHQPKIDNTSTKTMHTTAVSEFNSCVADHSRDNYAHNNILSSFGEKMAGRITVSACAAIISCPEDISPEEILTQAIEYDSPYTDEAKAVLSDPSNEGYVSLSELRKCTEVRVYNNQGTDELKVTGNAPMWFINSYPATPNMPVAPQN